MRDEERRTRSVSAAVTISDDNRVQSLDSDDVATRRSTLQLKCVDDSTFEVTYEQAMMSSTLWALMEKKPKHSSATHVVPVVDVPTESVQRALAYCTCLYSQQVDRVETAMMEWEDAFVRLESKELCDLAKIASNLDIQPLVDLTCRSIAQIMSATSEADELRRKFGLEDPPDVDCTCELRSDMTGFDFDMFDSLDHDLSTEEYELVEFDQPSVDELVSFINGSGSNPQTPPIAVQQRQAEEVARKNCHFHGENSLDFNDSNNCNVSSGKKKRKKRKKKKSPPASLHSDTKTESAAEPGVNVADKRVQESCSSDDENEAHDLTLARPASSRNSDSAKLQTLEEKVRLARQNPSAVFKESQFEDDDDEDMAKVIKMFEINLESAYHDSGNEKKMRLDFAPREVFRSPRVRSSQLEYVQRHRSATTT